MHLLIPYASAIGDAASHTLSELPLPHLAELLALLKPEGEALGGDEFSLNTPLELALAQWRGCSEPDGQLPTAAWDAPQAASTASLAWARLTPIHLAVGSDQITALPPERLALAEAESREFFAALSELWPASEGWHSHWLNSDSWLIAHPSLAGLSSASLDRVVHRHVDPWMPKARRLRTLQNEVQMLLHGHALNEERETRGALALNSVWISGCGVHQAPQALPTDLHIETRLREPLLAGDWQAWAHAWTQLDQGPIAQCLALARQASAGGQPQALRLTLCGERWGRSWQLPARSPLQRLWQRWLPPRADTAALLGAL